MSPKIDEPTIIEQRAMRQRQLIDAAMSLALEGGAPSVTVAAVAKRAGISRTLVYEYFSSSADLIADLVMEELDYYSNRLATAVGEVKEPDTYLELWIAEALSYGLPVITTRAAPWKDLETYDCGWWVDSSIAGVADGLVRAMDSTPEHLAEMGLRARHLIEERYSWDSIGKSANEAYEWVIDQSKKCPKFVHNQWDKLETK